MSTIHLTIWIIFLLTIILMLMRPRGISEVWWVAAGAAALVTLRLVPLRLAVHAVVKGTDVYLFLVGMMLLAQLAQVHGVFDWFATMAVAQARGSRTRLFALVYLFGTLVTVCMSNDATAVVLTPAVLAAVKKSKADPLPYLLACAFIANAASFVLPFSNPANLVVFHTAIPPLGRWLTMFLAASIASIATTYVALRWYCRNDLKGEMQTAITRVDLSTNGRLMLGGLGIVAVALMITSALGEDLGLPTFAASTCIALGLSVRQRTNPIQLAKGISWSVLPLVAGMFLLVEAVSSAGALHAGQSSLHLLKSFKALTGAMVASFGVGVGTNFLNNLPLGLAAGACIQGAHVGGTLRNAILIGIDLGPNLSVTGSLATILWLMAIRREGLHVSGWTFFKAGLLVMPPALGLATLAATFLSR